MEARLLGWVTNTAGELWRTQPEEEPTAPGALPRANKRQPMFGHARSEPVLFSQEGKNANGALRFFLSASRTVFLLYELNPPAPQLATSDHYKVENHANASRRHDRGVYSPCRISLFFLFVFSSGSEALPHLAALRCALRPGCGTRRRPRGSHGSLGGRSPPPERGTARPPHGPRTRLLPETGRTRRGLRGARPGSSAPAAR